MAQVIDKTIELDLTNVNGNAYAIMGSFSKQASREGWTKDEIDKVLDEAKTGDYDHLLQTIIAHTN